MSTDKETLEGYGCLLVIDVIAVVGYGGYQGLDSVGWIPHTQESVIIAQANWFVGESKDCTSFPLDAQSAKSTNKPTGFTVSQVNCDGGPEHGVKITFYGRIRTTRIQLDNLALYQESGQMGRLNDWRMTRKWPHQHCHHN
jgi:hypothetical protein